MKHEIIFFIFYLFTFQALVDCFKSTLNKQKQKYKNENIDTHPSYILNSSASQCQLGAITGICRPWYATLAIKSLFFLLYYGTHIHIFNLWEFLRVFIQHFYIFYIFYLLYITLIQRIERLSNANVYSAALWSRLISFTLCIFYIPFSSLHTNAVSFYS